MTRHSFSSSPGADPMPIPKTVRRSDIVRNTMQLFLTDGQAIHAGKGLLVPFFLPVPFSANDATVRQYQYRLQASQSKAIDVIHGKFIIYAPSLIGIWAHTILACVPGAKGLILDRAWAGSSIWLPWLAARLRYERIRLGSDVESPYLRKQIYHENLQKVLPYLTIGHWIDAVDKMRRQRVLPDGNFIFWQDKAQATDIRPWIASRFYNVAE